MRVPKRKNIGKHWKTLEYIKRVQDIRDKEMNETPTGVDREGSGQEMAGKGPDRRYPETVLEPLGSNSGLSHVSQDGWCSTLSSICHNSRRHDLSRALSWLHSVTDSEALIE